MWHGALETREGCLVLVSKPCRLAGSQRGVCVKTRTSLTIGVNHASDEKTKIEIEDSPTACSCVPEYPSPGASELPASKLPTGCCGDGAGGAPPQTPGLQA